MLQVRGLVDPPSIFKLLVMMCKLKGRMDKGVHYDVEMKGWMQRGHYQVHIKRADG